MIAFQNVIQGVLITIKSYAIRTLLLGCLFLFLPLAKILMIKAGLISLAPAILSRAGELKYIVFIYINLSTHTEFALKILEKGTQPMVAFKNYFFPLKKSKPTSLAPTLR